MKIIILQRDIEWASPEANRKRINHTLEHCNEADLLVLPEMFSTGFCTSPRGIAEPAYGKTLEWMLRTAQQRNCALAGSVATEEHGRYYNRFYFVKPDGHFESYDKRHLFTYGGEHLHFTAGHKRTIVCYKGIRFLLQICYDLRFPVFSRNKGDYDAALYIASWPTSRIAAWRALLTARAIENQCYVIGVNRTGSDPACEYCGGSAVIDPYGKTIAHCTDHTECEAIAELNIDMLRDFRSQFPVLDDADCFTLTTETNS